ncbi:MAG TPA: hypothetical protein EYN06_01420 [Myxococcales bacterium]|nr:hypothetical protein [Myxococcales bacterium]HIN85109.1 hypothetical protein [Myxococcales bacterium]
MDLHPLSTDSFEQEVVLKARVPGVAKPKRISPPKKRTKGASVKMLDPKIKAKRFPLKGVADKTDQAKKARKVRIQRLDEEAPREMTNQPTRKSDSGPRKIKTKTLGD